MNKPWRIFAADGMVDLREKRAKLGNMVNGALVTAHPKVGQHPADTSMFLKAAACASFKRMLAGTGLSRSK
ncbi:hypothetical protein [Pseudomethylobacillus aquaticus]|uniref:hypothetical protein n=1 Tax=Pseudomethylobacillus aquaticus TaxID=2676064 RepID=UPI0013903E9B|nr:hypothetical protein [Pseudomethylobacillus aquaticus]